MTWGNGGISETGKILGPRPLGNMSSGESANFWDDAGDLDVASFDFSAENLPTLDEVKEGTKAIEAATSNTKVELDFDVYLDQLSSSSSKMNIDAGVNRGDLKTNGKEGKNGRIEGLWNEDDAEATQKLAEKYEKIKTALNALIVFDRQRITAFSELPQLPIEDIVTIISIEPPMLDENGLPFEKMQSGSFKDLTSSFRPDLANRLGKLIVK